MVFGHQNFNHRKTGLPDLEPDVDMIRGLFHAVLPYAAANWPPQSDRNPINDRKVGLGEMPWEVLRSGQQKWREYTVEKLSQFTFAAN